MKQASALLAQVIDRQKKALQRFSRLAGGFAVAVGCSALVAPLIGRNLIVREQPYEGTGRRNTAPRLIFAPEG